MTSTFASMVASRRHTLAVVRGSAHSLPSGVSRGRGRSWVKGDLQARTVQITGADGDEIEAYLAEPLDAEPAGGVVVIHHMPGYDQGTLEITRRFAAEGYLAICPNLYSREAPGADP